MGSFRTPLRRVRGLGAAHHGAGHWISERLSAIALVPLVIWALSAGISLARTDYSGAVIWLQSPVNAVLTGLLVALSFWHMHSGMRVIIEDYLAKPGTKMACLVLNMFVCGFGGAIAVFCILKVALGGGSV